MTVKPDMRTLSDADVDAIAGRLRALLSRPWLPQVEPKKRQIEYALPSIETITPERVRLRAATANVTPENKHLHDMPEPMLKALLAAWDREHATARAA